MPNAHTSLNRLIGRWLLSRFFTSYGLLFFRTPAAQFCVTSVGAASNLRTRFSKYRSICSASGPTPRRVAEAKLRCLGKPTKYKPGI